MVRIERERSRDLFGRSFADSENRDFSSRFLVVDINCLARVPCSFVLRRALNPAAAAVPRSRGLGFSPRKVAEEIRSRTVTAKRRQ